MLSKRYLFNYYINFAKDIKQCFLCKHLNKAMHSRKPHTAYTAMYGVSVCISRKPNLARCIMWAEVQSASKAFNGETQLNFKVTTSNISNYDVYALDTQISYRFSSFIIFFITQLFWSTSYRLSSLFTNFQLVTIPYRVYMLLSHCNIDILQCDNPVTF